MSKTQFSFELITQDDDARLGIIKTPRGSIETPAFMPVGTQGTIKGIFIDDILKTKSEIILGNTYHLLLRPGIYNLNKFGGLHNFMNCIFIILIVKVFMKIFIIADIDF